MFGRGCARARGRDGQVKPARPPRNAAKGAAATARCLQRRSASGRHPRRARARASDSICMYSPPPRRKPHVRIAACGARDRACMRNGAPRRCARHGTSPAARARVTCLRRCRARALWLGATACPAPVAARNIGGAEWSCRPARRTPTGVAGGGAVACAQNAGGRRGGRSHPARADHGAGGPVGACTCSMACAYGSRAFLIR